MSSDLDLEQVRKVVASIEGAQDVLEFLSERERGRQDSSFDRIIRMMRQRGTPVTRETLHSIFSGWQKAGVGRLLLGKNRVPRFVWTYNLKTVANFALGGKSKAAVKKQKPPKVQLPSITEGAVKAKPVRAAARHVAPMTQPGGKTVTLRRGEFEIQIPLDGTPEEIEAATAMAIRVITRADKA